jgi:hypothetical protein
MSDPEVIPRAVEIPAPSKANLDEPSGGIDFERKRKSSGGSFRVGKRGQRPPKPNTPLITVGVWGVAGGVALWGILTPNVGLTFAAAVLLPLLFALLLRQGEVPLLLLGCLGQWLQVCTPLLVANYYGQTLEQQFGVPLRTEATWLGLMGIVAFAFGLRLAVGPANTAMGLVLEQEVSTFSVERLGLAWALGMALAVPVELVEQFLPGLSQVVGPLADFKTGFVFLMGYAVVQQRRGRVLFVCVVVTEFVVGTLGYFSGYRKILIILLLLLLTVTRFWNLRLILMYLALLIALVVSTSIWSAIKPGYREFLNQGNNQQVVLMPVSQRLEYLWRRARSMTAGELADGFQTTLQRIGYTEYFADTLGNLPANMPYEHGRLWWDAVSRVFMPRMFFPDKPAADDSYRTQKYAGVDVAGPEQGASIGLGYMTESYVDFGPYFMFVPIFVLAVFLGLAYRYFVLRSGMGAWGYVIVFAMPFISLHMFETSNVKLIGPLVSGMILFVPLDYFFGNRIKAWLRSSNNVARVSRRQRTLRPQPSEDIAPDPGLPDAATQPKLAQNKSDPEA